MRTQEKEPIEGVILKILQKGTIQTAVLLGNVALSRPKTTKQGIYRALRKLKNEEKIVIHGKSVSLNLHWIKNMNDFFSLAHFYYTSKATSADNFLNIREKDKIVYFFKNLNLLDSFWSHAFHLFSEISNPKEPIFVYNPHEWFAYARRETEQALIKTMNEKTRPVLITVAHGDSLDRQLTGKLRSEYVQYLVADKNVFEKQNYYFNIFGDIFIEVLIDPGISRQIDVFFKKTTVFNDEANDELLNIVSKSGKNKLIISRNKKKAEKYKKMLSKDFYIKR